MCTFQLDSFHRKVHLPRNLSQSMKTKDQTAIEDNDKEVSVKVKDFMGVLIHSYVVTCRQAEECAHAPRSSLTGWWPVVLETQWGRRLFLLFLYFSAKRTVWNCCVPLISESNGPWLKRLLVSETQWPTVEEALQCKIKSTVKHFLLLV